MSKIIKSLIIINGLLIPILLIVIVYKTFESQADNYYGTEPVGIDVGEDFKNANKDSLALQGIVYNEPVQVYNSKNYYLTIGVMTYQEARDFKNAVSSAGDMNPYDYQNYFNVIFLDKDFNYVRELLSRKASISYVYVNDKYYDYNNKNFVDTTAKHIAYMIGFEDSNKNGKLDVDDDHDLFISSLDGSNLIQVTKGISVRNFEFINGNKEILINYKDRNSIKDEYKRIKFAKYNIVDKRLSFMKELDDKLDALEKSLNTVK
jgi:hypothetical protein